MKFPITLTVFLFCLSFLFASFVPLSEAEQIGSSVFASLKGGSTGLDSIDEYGVSQPGDLPDLYILRFKPRGFVLVAAEEQSQPVLGYSLEADFPTLDMPAHVDWYLQQYSRGIEEIRENSAWPVDPGWELLRAGNFDAFQPVRNVSPLCATNWDQGWPYNSMCPADSDGPGGHVWAGCVATAMAQIMKKWNYPVMGEGSHSYVASGYGTQSADFGATTYNWGSMPNSISSVNSCISTLIYHCGVSVDMGYSPDGSGAYSSDARNALTGYFRYNSDAQYYWAGNYSAANWSAMLRADLDLGRPIFYRGQSTYGHAFVLDGYQGTDYFHFNWGWSGYYNGYFYLSNLNPGSYDFNEYQGAILHIYPEVTNTNDLEAVSLIGSSAPSVGISSDYTVTVLNSGQNAQSSYTVQLYRDSGVFIASSGGTTINPGESLDFTLPWTPESEGSQILYGKVVLGGDDNPANDQTPNLNVSVLPEGVNSVTIGDGNASGRTPLDFWYKNSLYECIFYPSELGFYSGTVMALQFFNDFETDLPNGATKIWLGSTSLEDLSGGYIPSTQLTLVFDGVVQYPSGSNTITIPLQTHYLHTTGNIVMMVNRPMDTTYYSSDDLFLGQNLGSDRARNAYSDYTNYNPLVPPTGSLISFLPKTTFIWMDAEPQAPQNVQVSFLGSQLNLDWDDVTQDVYGYPASVSHYEVHVSEVPDFECTPATLVDTVPESQATYDGVASYYDKIFIKIVAVTGGAR